MIGSPMGAGGFGTLAGHFPDRTVVTYDPRGVERSTKDDPASQSTPEEHADDLHRLIAALGAGPVDMFASSGGAVNALALVAAHPDRSGRWSRTSRRSPRCCPTARPPWRPAARSATPTSSGFGAGMARFIAVVSHQGPFTADDVERSRRPDPAMFGLPTEDDGTRTDPLLGQNIVSCTHYEPDIDALRAAPTRIVVGVPARSRRASWPTAARSPRPSGSGTRPVIFPATTAASWAASTARPASRTRSPRSCARCSPRSLSATRPVRTS